VRRGGKPSRKPLTAFAAALALAIVLTGCASPSYAGIPLTAGAADAELQSLAGRARAGDKDAQLELGIRYEEGRGVERDSESARRLYLSSLEGPRLQTTYVPVNGAVVPQNTAIGRVQTIWPPNFGQIRDFHPSRIAAVLRLCGLEPRPGREPDCRSEDAALLRQLAQFETNFRACRIRTQLGDAGIHPAPFLFNGIDQRRRIETRLCMLEGPVPNAIPSDQSRLIWTMWLALERFGRCAGASPCGRDEIRRHFTDEIAAYREDSLMWFAMRDALRQYPKREIQVGGSWWWNLCGSLPEERRITATDAETKICALIENADPDPESEVIHATTH
jgi:hypothetical protein